MTNLTDISNALAGSVATAAQSIVTVLAPRPVSGTVIRPDLILTVAHVLRGDETHGDEVHGDGVQILTPDGRTLSATVTGRDDGSDLALLRVQGLDMPPLSASQGARVGELLLAVGRSGQGPQASLGLYQGAGGHGAGRTNWLNSGALPVPGLSGGALLDARGALVGILNAGLPRRIAARGPQRSSQNGPQPTLLALPIERALTIATQLEQLGRVPRGYLGIATQPVRFPGAAEVRENGAPENRAPEKQAQEERGWPGHIGSGPAWSGPTWSGRGGRGFGRMGRGFGPEAGFDPRTADPRHTFNPRTFDPRRVMGRPGFAPDFGPQHIREQVLQQMQEHLGARGPQRAAPDERVGLVIVQMDEGSPAQQAGLKRGDVLLSLGGEALSHPHALLDYIRHSAGETLVARILRGGEEQDLQLTVGQH